MTNMPTLRLKIGPTPAQSLVELDGTRLPNCERVIVTCGGRDQLTGVELHLIAVNVEIESAEPVSVREYTANLERLYE